MFSKLRRKSKDPASPLATATPPQTKDHIPPKRKTITFYDLPSELRINIYELIAQETKLSLFSNPPQHKNPSLLFVTHQVRTEYRPILLSLAPVQAHIYKYDFRPLIRLIGSLYSTELKALRANNHLTILLHLGDFKVTERERITLLRRWTVKRAEHLDRLQWSYELAVDQPGRINYPAAVHRSVRLWQSILAVRQLQGGVHESLAAELQPVLDAMLVRYVSWDAAKMRAWDGSEAHDERLIWVD